jgi:hypothetical protein
MEEKMKSKEVESETRFRELVNAVEQKLSEKRYTPMPGQIGYSTQSWPETHYSDHQENVMHSVRAGTGNVVTNVVGDSYQCGQFEPTVKRNTPTRDCSMFRPISPGNQKRDMPTYVRGIMSPTTVELLRERETHAIELETMQKVFDDKLRAAAKENEAWMEEWRRAMEHEVLSVRRQPTPNDDTGSMPRMVTTSMPEAQLPVKQVEVAHSTSGTEQSKPHSATAVVGDALSEKRSGVANHAGGTDGADVVTAFAGMFKKFVE